MHVIADATAQLMNEAPSGPHQQELAGGRRQPVENGEQENRQAYAQRFARRIVASERRPNPRQPIRRGAIAEHVIDQPLDRPRLQQFEGGRHQQEQRAAGGVATGQASIGEQSPNHERASSTRVMPSGFPHSSANCDTASTIARFADNKYRKTIAKGKASGSR